MSHNFVHKTSFPIMKMCRRRVERKKERKSEEIPTHYFSSFLLPTPHVHTVSTTYPTPINRAASADCSRRIKSDLHAARPPELTKKAAHPLLRSVIHPPRSIDRVARDCLISHFTPRNLSCELQSVQRRRPKSLSTHDSGASERAS